MIHFTFCDIHYPSEVYYETEKGIGVRYRFDKLGNVKSIVYNSFGTVYKLLVTDKFRGSLYCNNEINTVSKRDRLRFKFVQTLLEEDTLALMLKYQIDISLLAFDENSQLTDDSCDNIHQLVMELAVEEVTRGKADNPNFYAFLWRQNEDAFLTVLGDKYKSK